MISLDSKWVHPEHGFDIDPLTLARHLGRVVRFGGAVNTWYSVLQHSLFVADVAGVTWANAPDVGTRLATVSAYSLLHDAHEFLTGDVPTDWKRPAHKKLEETIDVLIRSCLSLVKPTESIVALVKEADEVALILEGNYVSPYSVAVVTEKFARPDLIERWSGVFSKYYCPDPYLAFKRNWDKDGLYVKQYANALEVALGLIRS